MSCVDNNLCDEAGRGHFGGFAVGCLPWVKVHVVPGRAVAGGRLGAAEGGRNGWWDLGFPGIIDGVIA